MAEQDAAVTSSGAGPAGKHERLSFLEKAGYACGDVASNLFWMIFVFFPLKFYVDAFGLRAEDVGTMFGVVRLWDAVNDPIMGLVADRTRTRWGKFRPYLLWLSLPFAILGIVVFTTPDWEYANKLVYAYVSYTLFGMVYTAINIPYSSLMGVISPDPEQRTVVSTYRFIGAYSGGLVVKVFTMGLVGVFGAGDLAKGFQLTATMYALLAVGFFTITFFATKERVVPSSKQQSNALKDLGDLFTNVPWLILFTLGIFTLGYVSIRYAAAVYYLEYYVGLQPVFGQPWSMAALIGAFFLVGSVANLLGTPLTAPVAKKFGKKATYVAFMGISALLTVLFFFLKPADLGIILVIEFFINFFMAPTAALVYSMYTDAADYNEWKRGRRSTGMVMSASMLAQKLGWTVGGMVGGWLLGWYGYEKGVAPSAETIMGIRLMVSFIPAVGAVLATLAVLLYPLGDRRMKSIQRELEAARSSDGETEASA